MSLPCEPDTHRATKRTTSEFDALLAGFHQSTCQTAIQEVMGEFEWQGFRLIVAHRPEVAMELSAARDEHIAALEADAARWAGKLDGQELGQTYRGKKLSDAGTKARFYKPLNHDA